MIFFAGTYILKLDQKSRVSLPAPFRHLVAGDGGFYLFPSPQHQALEACPAKFMAKLNEAVNHTAPLFSKTEDDMTWLFAEARQMAVDDTGRFVIPDDFIHHADLPLGGNVVFVGHGGRFFIWNEKNWQVFKQNRKLPHNLELKW